MSQYRTKPCRCPVCETPLDAVTAIQDGASAPEAGDVSICIKCTAFLVFNEDITVRLLTAEEIADLPCEARSLLVGFRAHINATKVEKENA